MQSAKEHWEKVYLTKQAHAVSWFQEHATRSMEIIRSVGATSEARIIDVGGGASTQSVVMRSKSGTVRFIEARHHFDRKPAYGWMTSK